MSLRAEIVEPVLELCAERKAEAFPLSGTGFSRNRECVSVFLYTRVRNDFPNLGGTTDLAFKVRPKLMNIGLGLFCIQILIFERMEHK